MIFPSSLGYHEKAASFHFTPSSALMRGIRLIPSVHNAMFWFCGGHRSKGTSPAASTIVGNRSTSSTNSYVAPGDCPAKVKLLYIVIISILHSILRISSHGAFSEQYLIMKPNTALILNVNTHPSSNIIKLH